MTTFQCHILSWAVATIGITNMPLTAQGPLSPPGAPAPTMKTIQQIEPRTDVVTLSGDASNQYIISQPGSYYLTGNLEVTLTDGIDIRVSDVTLDLGGYVVRRGSGTGGNGIEVAGSSVTCVTLKNGAIEGFANGVFLNSASACHLSQLAIQGGGSGIVLNENCRANLIHDCSVTGTSGDGIVAKTNAGKSSRNLIQRSTVSDTGAHGIHIDGSNMGSAKGNSIRSCTISDITNDGIRFSGGNAHLNGNLLTESNINSTGGNGVHLNALAAFANGNLLSGLNVSRPTLDGIALVSPSSGNVNGNLLDSITVGNPGSSYISLEVVQSGAVKGNWIRHCLGREASTIGIDCNGGSLNRIEENHLSRTPPFIGAINAYGIRTQNCEKNFVWRNCQARYSNGYLIDADDTFGPLISTSGFITTSGSDMHPKANFSR